MHFLHYSSKIDSYENLYSEMEGMASRVVFDYWCLLDTSPFKHSLLSTIKQWAEVFKQYLVNKVRDSTNYTISVTEMDEFLSVTAKGISAEVSEGDYDALVAVMAHLGHVRDRLHRTDALFGPLAATIALISNYNQDLPETIHLLLQELPERWETLKKQCDLVRQQLAPVKAIEVDGIKKRIVRFDSQQLAYRQKFRSYSFFRYECDLPYWRLERVNARLQRLEADAKKLHLSAQLFEVQLPDFKMIKACRRELKMLKQVWDHVFSVNSSVNHWKKTPWRDIDVEAMDIECKKFAKDLRALDKEMRSWDVYMHLDSAVKNMLTSLRATIVVNSPETTLADLLNLQLHAYEDEVKNIVDKAVKEMSMEKTIKELEVTWAALEFESDRHPRTGIALVRTTEEMIETLEENQVQLQNLLTSKYVEHFLEAVSGWQKKLLTSDQVINIWFEVQRTWSHLESIFIGSDDIREQLPEDSARFDQIDADFKSLMTEMVARPNVLESTNRPGLFKSLEQLQKQLTVCEKTLAEYLETKRLAFPRFYFVSTADLLDILSNGNLPLKVAR
ncbi:hypothetical protein HAZT_HAZT000174 [Hyalella azteca]|uniref:Dynein heavy chain linker domain-containing protein n=1 Tax=Hyalella azteca TaxID=294128 RepID=A0A6A0H1L2_HYAAZ|nr:hypothetical protein HAZT_HAZT000174 [Hyalella azteca]